MLSKSKLNARFPCDQRGSHLQCEHFVGRLGNSLEDAGAGLNSDNSNDNDRSGDAEDLEPVMVTLTFQTDQPDPLMSVLAKYVVLSRGHPGCRNIDFVASATTPGRLLVVEKWDSAAAQRTHFDSAEMVTMAQSCDGLLTGPPEIDLYEGVSMHDTA